MASVGVFLGPMWSGKTSRLISAIAAQRSRFARVRVIKPQLDTRAPASLIVARTGLQQQADLCVADLREVRVGSADPPTLFAVDEAQFFGDGLLDLFERIAACAPPPPQQQQQPCAKGGAAARPPASVAPGGGSPAKPDADEDAGADAAAAAEEAAEAAAATSPHGLLVAGLDFDFKGAPFGSVLELARRVIDAAGARGAGAGACSSSGSGAVAAFAAAGLGEVIVERLTARCDHRGGAHAPACGRAAAFSQRLVAGGGATVLVGGGEFYAPACAAHHRASPGDPSEWGR